MMRSAAFTLVFSLGLLTAARAALITEVYTVALPSASAHYGAGHVFKITATYDNAGTVMNTWGDGPDEKADFGENDDISLNTYHLSNDPYALFYSDASISIAGLLPPPGNPADFSTTNYTRVYEGVDIYSNRAFWALNYLADGLAFDIVFSGHGYMHFFNLVQAYLSEEGELLPTTSLSVQGQGLITREVLTVPEPASFALLSLGLVGAGLALRRKNQRLGKRELCKPT